MWHELNLFKRPLKPATIDSWVKWQEDISKITVVAIFTVVVHPSFGVLFKVLSALALSLATYSLLLGARLLQDKKDQLTQGS